MSFPSTAPHSGPDAPCPPEFFGSVPSIMDLAAQQGVQPLKNLSDLRGEFWPDSEDIDDLAAAVRDWRNEIE